MTKENPRRSNDKIKRKALAQSKTDKKASRPKTNLHNAAPVMDMTSPTLSAESIQQQPTITTASPTTSLPSLAVGAVPPAVTAPSPTSTMVSMSALRKDPIYRIMHRQPRSDQLEIVKCKFGPPQCEKAARYFDMSFMQNPLRRLRLQIGCQGDAGLSLFFPRIFHHRASLRLLDLSRNRMNADDVKQLCDGLGLGVGAAAASRTNGDDASSSSSSSSSCALEILDLSYNSLINNEGAVHVLSCAASYGKLKALQLKCVGMDDNAAPHVHRLLSVWPRPNVAPEANEALWFLAPRGNESRGTGSSFLLNLNENFIGATGTTTIGRGLPSYVSVTMSKQRFQRTDRQ